MLRNCNFYHRKNKNNDSFHKRDSGKLMQTMGMPISDFLEKTNLKTKSLNKAERHKIDYSQVQSKYNNIYNN